MNWGSVKKYRIYFNRRGAGTNEAWSIDTGEGTKRRHFRSVVFACCGQAAETVYNGQEPNWKDPVAWIEITGKLKVFEKVRAQIVAISDSGE